MVQPPEDWLFKVFTDGTMVDIVYRLNSAAVGRAGIERADELRGPVGRDAGAVGHRRGRQLKLNALDEHYCDFGTLLPVARALREQVDWERVRAETEENDFAAALLCCSSGWSVIDG